MVELGEHQRLRDVRPFFQHARDGGDDVVLDLRHVAFFDVSGLRVVQRSHHHAAGLGRSLTVRVTGQPLRVFALCHRLDLIDGRDVAPSSC